MPAVTTENAPDKHAVGPKPRDRRGEKGLGIRPGAAVLPAHERVVELPVAVGDGLGARIDELDAVLSVGLAFDARGRDDPRAGKLPGQGVGGAGAGPGAQDRPAAPIGAPAEEHR